ncbi:MAG TPA: FkbM family methyltransferase [Puia sp.]|nr:FkbM family methyltransferase [Puia sp.]
MIKKILLSVLGEKRYLSLLASSFQRVFPTGWLGSSYQDIYFLKNIIGEGAYCVDIGAHLGYYTLELSRLVKASGKVIAIEPMSKFNQALRDLLKQRRVGNTTVYQVAMGGDGPWVDMGIPRIGSMKKFAYARVMNSNTTLEYIESERVKNESGDHLFLGLPRVDFIKCDVEGLELSVFSSMTETIRLHQPILLCELGAKQDRISLLGMVAPFGYRVYLLEKGRLRLLDPESDRTAISHNHYFLPAKHAIRLRHLIDD